MTRYDEAVKDMGAILGWIGPGGEPLDPDAFGDRAALLSRAAALGLPVPPGVALPAPALAGLGREGPALAEAVGLIEAATGQSLGDPQTPLLLSLRPARSGCGGVAPAILDIGAALRHGPRSPRATGARSRGAGAALVQSYGSAALGIESEDFEYALHDALKARRGRERDRSLRRGADRAGRGPARADRRGRRGDPRRPLAQLADGIAALAAAWASPRARLRREAPAPPPTPRRR